MQTAKTYMLVTVLTPATALTQATDLITHLGLELVHIHPHLALFIRSQILRNIPAQQLKTVLYQIHHLIRAVVIP
ncbi:hypothetical protein ABT47_14810 [Shewanella xiamenensis]|nr:hypothetical protein ABT47_14810 [Shewanella xiamenensis]